MKSEEPGAFEELDPADSGQAEAQGSAPDAHGASPHRGDRGERLEAANRRRLDEPSSGKRHKKRRKGVFDARRVRFVSFVVIAIGLFVTSAFCILAIWKYTSRDTAWRALSTLGVVAGTMFIFTLINEMFGASMEE